MSPKTERAGMDIDETLNAILARAIGDAQARDTNPSLAATEAANAFKDGLAAFNGAKPVLEVMPSTQPEVLKDTPHPQ